MALKSTVFKVALQVADLDRHYYAEHTLTTARHPSETDQRMMVRLLAFALFASDTLAFTRGLSTDNEPDLWDRNLNDEIVHWIELGNPDEKRVRRACRQANRVTIINYHARSSDVWWQSLQGQLGRFPTLSVLQIADEHVESMAGLVERSMALQCTIQDGVALLTTDDTSLDIALDYRLRAG